MNNKLDYPDQIRAQIRKARKEKNAQAVVYYSNALNFSACVSFASYSGSWAFDTWLRENAAKIAEVEAEFKRFAYLS